MSRERPQQRVQNVSKKKAREENGKHVGWRGMTGMTGTACTAALLTVWCSRLTADTDGRPTGRPVSRQVRLLEKSTGRHDRSCGAAFRHQMVDGYRANLVLHDLFAS